jgi:hypothetical protein
VFGTVVLLLLGAGYLTIVEWNNPARSVRSTRRHEYWPGSSRR